MKHYGDLTWATSLRDHHFIRVLVILRENNIPYSFSSLDTFTVSFKFHNDADEAHFLLLYGDKI